MKKVQAHTRKKETSNEDDMYINVSELTEENSNRRVEKAKTPKNKTMSTSNTKLRVILAALIILIIMFLMLSVIIGVLLKLSNDRQKTVQKDLENFLQHIKTINKTLEILCRTCPPGWKSIGLFCYYFSTDSLSWYNATDDCIQKGSTLLVLKNKEESDALKPLLGDDHYWIGLMRDKDPENWRWLDGSILSFRNWNIGEPNNENVEHCVESFGDWNNRQCSSILKFVCKKGSCC